MWGLILPLLIIKNEARTKMSEITRISTCISTYRKNIYNFTGLKSDLGVDNLIQESNKMFNKNRLSIPTRVKDERKFVINNKGRFCQGRRKDE